MSITGFIPEVWAAQLQESLLKELVFASPLCVNRDYEGDIAQAGDTVHITSISRPTIAPYTKDVTTITPETLTDAQRSLIIDQCKYFAFEVDDLDKRQSAGGGALMAAAAREAGAGLAEAADAFVQGLMESDTAAGNIIGATQTTTSAKAVERLIALKQLLDAANVPQNGRYCVVPSWFHSLLLLDDRFITIDSFSGGHSFANGVVGKAMGFDIKLANYALSTGDDWYIYAGHPIAITFADQINKVEAYRPENAFSDALKGLHLYGAKVVRPTALAINLCSVT